MTLLRLSIVKARLHTVATPLILIQPCGPCQVRRTRKEFLASLTLGKVALSCCEMQETQELITQGSKTRMQGSKTGLKTQQKARIRIQKQGHGVC